MRTRGAYVAALMSGCAFFYPERLPPGPPPLPLAADVQARAPLTARWIGHATVLLRLGEVEIVTDPFLRQSLVGMPRVSPVGLLPGEVPRPRAVVISHLHFDHCDVVSLEKLAAVDAALVLPRGAAHQLPPLRFGRVVELSWWESVELGELTVTAIPVDHFGGRYGTDAWNDHSYAGYVLEAAGRRVVFAGDTGYQTGWAREVGKRFPGADLALIPIAPYREGGVDSPIHVAPGGAMRIFADLGALRMLPIHYETFFQGFRSEGITGPRARLRALAQERKVGDRVWDLYPGETLAIDGELAWRLSGSEARAQAPTAGVRTARADTVLPAAANGAGAGETVSSPLSFMRAAGPLGAMVGRALPSTTLRVSPGGGLSAGVSWEVEPVTLAFRTLAGPQLFWLGAPLAARAAGSLGLHLALGARAGPVPAHTLWGALELRATLGWEDLTATLGGGWYARGGGPFAIFGLATFDGVLGLSARLPLREGAPSLFTQEIVWH